MLLDTQEDESLQSRTLWESRQDSRDELLIVHHGTDRKREALESVSTTVEKCPEIGRAQDPFASPCSIAAARIVLAGKRAGALIHEEAAAAQKGHLVSVFGTSFLVDFHLYTGVSSEQTQNTETSNQMERWHQVILLSTRTLSESYLKEISTNLRRLSEFLFNWKRWM